MAPLDLIGEVLDHLGSLGVIQEASVILKKSHLFKPDLKFRCRSFAQNFSNIKRIVEGGALVGEHDVITAGNSHDVVTACDAQEREKVIHVVLVGFGMVGVANVTSHGETQELSAKMILKTCTNDLFRIVKVFWTDESNDGIDQKRRKLPRHSIGSGLQSLSVNAMMGVGRKRAALAGLEIHDVLT